MSADVVNGSGERIEFMFWYLLTLKSRKGN